MGGAAAPTPALEMTSCVIGGASEEWSLAAAISAARSNTEGACMASDLAASMYAYHLEAERERSEGSMAPHVAAAMSSNFSTMVLRFLSNVLDTTGCDTTMGSAAFADVVRILSWRWSHKLLMHGIPEDAATRAEYGKIVWQGTRRKRQL